MTSQTSDKKNRSFQKKRAICGICPAGCWVNVELKNRKLVGIEADESHPLGMICKRGEHAPEIVYSKHRLKKPLMRTGPKGTFQFKPITWDQAYTVMAEQLNRIKSESGPEAVSIYTGRGAFELSLCDVFQPKDAAVSSASSVFFPFGSPNTMGVGALCYVSFAMIAPHVTMGRMLINMFTDIENSDLILVWGANPFTDSPPLDMARLESACRRGADVVVIDPRYTETAKRTGAQWIPIRPGTDGALALSMVQVLLEEDLHDDGFAEKWTAGFDDLSRYVQHFRPEQVEPVTGVKAETIRRLTRSLVRANGAAPVMYTGLEYSNSGIQAIRAVLTLFALSGNLDVPGGLCLSMPHSHFPINRENILANPDLKHAVARDKYPLYSRYRGESHASGLVDSVLEGEPYRIRSLIVHGASILTSWPQSQVWRETLSKLDFLVSIDRQMTADCAYADIVLPATTMFEIESYMTYGPIFRIREKVIEPVGEARDDYLIMAHLADRLGYGHLFPQTRKDMLKHILKTSGFTLEQVRKAGGTVQIESPVMEYKKWEKGKLRPDGRPGFDTPTGKFEIQSTVLKDYGYNPLPEYIEPSEGPLTSPEMFRRFPLVFNSGARSQSYFRSQHHGIPGLVKDHPEPIAEINRKDAEARGIESGDLVSVKTGRGEVLFRALVSEHIKSGSIECNMGGGGPVGPDMWKKSNVNELTDLSNYDSISGFPVYKALLCDIKKVSQGKSPKAVHREFDSHSQVKLDKIKKTPPVRRIYLDNNATSAVLPEIKKAMSEYFDISHGNPSSIHQQGRKTREAIEQARRQVAALLNAPPRRLIFTSGGSEANNLALKGIAFRHLHSSRKNIITSAVEHPAVLQTCAFLERLGFDVTYLPVDEYGMVLPETLEKSINSGTVLVSIMTANNETGTIMPVQELAAVAHAHGAVFHTDAVQAAGKIPVDAECWEADLLTLSGHKFHGPKGIGALYVKKGLELEPLIHGGSQEQGLRAGTENVPAIAGMGKTAETALKYLKTMPKIKRLRDRLETGIKSIVKDARLNGHPDNRLPNTLNMIIPKYRGESLAIAMDQKGVSLSSGSACKTGSPEPSPSLLAMGLSPEEAHCSIRLSLSRLTTSKDIQSALNAFKTVVEEMASTVRFLPCK
ncbi:MAG: aminotransferase class V-fold PLP-dependent enzyme [Candidatus Aminicenantes bacterium]